VGRLWANPEVFMRRILVWDLPVRLFHVLFAVAFTVSALLGFFGDDESRIFAAHLIAGLVAALLVFLRLGWGLVGSRTAGLDGFRFSPSELVAWLRAAAKGEKVRVVGHNPATSFAAVALAVLVVALAGTGVVMARGGEWVEEAHELLAWAAVLVVAAHIMGAVMHGLRHRDGTVSSMVTGHKTGSPEEGIASARPLAAIGLVALTGAWAGLLVQGFDPTTGMLQVPLLGDLQAVEVEVGGEEAEGEEARVDDDDHAEEDDDNDDD
jgi:cytochrome b